MDRHHWYAIQTTAGHEKKVMSLIQRKIEQDPRPEDDRLIRRVMVPTQEVVEIKNGKKVTVERKLYPGYVLVEMIMTDESWYVVRNTPGVTGFVGAGNKPTPLLPSEVEQIRRQMGVDEPRPLIRFEVGESVKVTEGPFEGFIGQVFKTIGRHLPPPPGAKSPALWGTREAIETMFGAGARSIELVPQTFPFRYRSPEHFSDVFRTWYGPVHKAFGALPAEGAAALERDLTELMNKLNVAGPKSLVVPSDYVEIVVTLR